MAITATLEKKKGGKIGLKLTSEGGKLWVTKIAEGGAMDLAKTALEVGMEVLEINGQNAVGMASTDAAKMMLDTDGTLTIKAQRPLGAFVCGTFHKESATTKVGLRLEEGDDKVMINSIREDTLAATTDLDGGMTIRLINNTNCVGKDAMFVAQLLADAVGTVTVVAETAEAGELADRELVSAAVVKEEGAKLGLTLTEVDDKLVVTKIKEGGLISKTDLDVGMEIYSINNIPVAGKSSTEAAGILIEAKGTLTILAFKNEDKAKDEPEAEGDAEAESPKAPSEEAVAAAANGREVVTVTVEKKPGAKLGLTLSELDGQLVVTKVKEGGLVAGTKLVAGMEIFSINGIEVAGKSSTEAAGILVDASGALTIIAFKDGNVGGDEEGEKVSAAPPAAAGGDSMEAAKAAAAGREIVVVKVTKQEGTKLGLTLSEIEDKLVVTKVKEGGLVAGTDLTAGMEIFSINGTEVAGKSSSDAASILVDAKGELAIVAFKGKVDGDEGGEKSAAPTGADALKAAKAAAAGREVVSVTVQKKEGAKLGLTLSEIEKKLVVTKVKEGGLVAGTALAPGMEIFSINGIEVAGKSSSEAASILVEAKGSLTILAFKEEAKKEGESKGGKVAKAAAAATVAAATATVATAAAVAKPSEDKSSSGTGAAAAAAAAAKGREVVTVVVEKEEGSKLGLTLSEVEQSLYVTKIKEDGLVASTALEPGMEVFTINGIEVAGKSSAEAAGILVAAKGTVTIVAFKGDLDGSSVGASAASAPSAPSAPSAASAASAGRETVTVTVQKQEGAKLGLTLSELGKKLVVTKVKEGGLVAGTALAPGMEIFSINGIEVAGKSSSEAASILVDAKGSLTIVAFKDPVVSGDDAVPAKAPAAVSGRETVTVSVQKKEGAKLGLSLSEVGNKLMVTKVKEGGLVAGTELAPGMEIFSINGTEVAGKSSSEAAALLVEAKGTLTIVAFKGDSQPTSSSRAIGAAAVAGAAAGAGAAAAAGSRSAPPMAIPRSASIKSTKPPGTFTMAAIKKGPGERLGFRLGQLNDNVVVSGIGEGSLASKTAIEPGMVLVLINNQSCVGKDTTEIAKMLGEAGDDIVIVAITPGQNPAPKSLVSAVVTKGAEDKVGVTLTQQNGKLVITKLKDDGLLANTGLGVGMEILSIDNETCVGKSSPEAAQLFKRVEGTLMILAQKPALAAGALVTAALSRDSPDSKLGIRLGVSNGTVVITNLAEGSLAASTDLEPGMVVRAINNADTAGMESTDAANILKEAEGIITILAETRSQGGGGADIKSLVAASVVNTKGSNLGLTLAQSAGKLVISKIDEDGLFFGTPLRVGMEVLKINNVDCKVLTQEASELLMQKEGLLTVLAKRSEIAPGTILTAVINKETVETKVGLGLGVSNGMIIVTKIRDGTLGSTTDLRPGMVLRTINNVSCEGKDSMGVAKLLSEAVGTITIVAEAIEGTKSVKPPKFYTATVEKTAGDKVGLGVAQKGGALYVTKIAEGGLVEGSGLEVGMEIVVINNIDCTKKTSAEVAEILQEAEGRLVILAKKPPLAPGTLVTASFTKESADTKVGLKLGKSNNVIVVAGIGENSLAAGTDLEPGMVVRSINNTDCSQLDVAGAAKLLIEAEGILTVLAEVPKGRVGGAGSSVIASLITATAKKEKDVAAGVVLERSNGRLVVTEIVQEGALFGTGLRVGMEVVSINNVDASVLSTASANGLLKAEGALTILAKPVSLPPGTLMTAAFTKADADTKVGLGLGVSNGSIVITKVRDGTVAATTSLEVGMVIRAINNMDCTKRSSEAAAKILKEATGTVTVLAEKPKGSGIDLTLPVSSLFAITFKKEKDAKVGLTLNNEGGVLNVKKIGEESLLANTRLRVGMEVIKINNVDTVGMSPTEAGTLLAEAEGSITILAKKASAEPGKMVTAVMNKSSADAKVGIGLGSAKGAIVITAIRDDTLAAATDLEAGMVIRTINNTDVGELDTTAVAKLLKESEGQVTVVAEAPSSTYEPMYDSLFTATIDKDAGEKLGLTIAGKGDKVYISKIQSDSLVAGSGLAVGMELLSVNNVPCAGKPSSETSKLMAESQGTLTLLARKAALPPGSFVTALITKESPEAKVGLRLGTAAGLLVVSGIGEDSLAATTDLKQGMILRTINNVDCSGMNPSEAAKLLIEAETISILAETPSKPGVAADAPDLSTFVTVSVSSASGSDVGLSLVRENGKLLVSEIAEGGPIVGTALRVGMEVVKINNIDCGVLSADAASNLLTSEQTLTILARKPVLAPGTLVTAVVKKDSMDTKVGLRMGSSKGMIVVSGVADGSLASMTPLEAGMVIRSINNMDVSKKSSTDAAKLLGGAVGLITILAEVPSSTAAVTPIPSLVTASIDKDGESENGVTFEEAEGGGITVASISPSGKWSTTRLRVGMKVRMINTFSCDGRSPSELDTIIEKSTGKVSILAEVQPLPPGTLVTAVLPKESASTKVGLGIGMIGGKVYITSIKNDTLATPTDLRNGMQIRLINNVDCTEMEAADVGRLLAEAEGNVTVVAAMPGQPARIADAELTPLAASAFKEKDAKVGLTVVDKGGKIYISKIDKQGLLGASVLKVGMELISINNVQMEGKKASDCATLLKEAEGTLTVLASHPVLPPGSFVTAVINKESKGTKVGLRLGDEGGKIVVTGVADGSLASETPLKPGMCIRAINNVDCTGLSTSDAAKLLVDGEGPLTILATTQEKSRQPSASLESICAVTVTNTGESELGMKVARKNGTLVVTEISPDGLIFGTALRVGMEIMTINNADCSVLSAESGTKLLESEGTVTILAKKKDLPPGFLVTAVIEKSNPEVKVGLGMGSKNGIIYITKIRDGTVAAITELQPGLIVRTIDNIDMSGMSLVDAANLLANAEGTITVAAEMPGNDTVEQAPTLIVAHGKTSKDEKVGMALATRSGVLYVSQLSEDGIMAGTALAVGMKILAINNIPCGGMSVSDAATLLRDAEGDLVVLAQKPVLEPGALVTATITKESVDSKIGLRLARSGNIIIVKSISPDSLASKTDLKAGMIVKSIDNTEVSGLDAASAGKLLTEAEGTVTVVAQNAGQAQAMPASTLVTVTVKKAKGTKTGLAVRKKGGKTFVSRLDSDGPFFGSGLRVGMEVLKINNVDCLVLSTTSADSLMAKEGMLTILAKKTLKKAGVLVAASFMKPTKDSKAGIGLGKSKGRIIVTKITNGTPASMTEIQQGMVVRQVNGVACGDLDSTETAKMIGSAEGIVTMLLETPSAGDSVATESLIKSLATAAVDMDKEGDLGLTLINKNGALCVSKVAVGSKFANTGIRPGMTLLSINNLNCAKKQAADAMKSISEASGLVTLLAQKPFLGPAEMVTATINRPDESTPIGLGLGSSPKSDKIVITSVKPGSLAHFTDLYPGMAVKSINNQQLKGKTTEEAAKILKASTGIFAIAAESMLDFDPELINRKIQTKPATITATMTKIAGGKVGLLLGEKGNKLFVSKIVPGGLASETELRVGMQVLSVNNVNCTNMPVGDAAKILLEAEGPVTILAKQPELSPGALITVSIDKEKPDSPLGLGLGVLNEKVVISSIKYGSAAAKTDLQVGMAVKAVNNVDCSRKETKDVAKLFADATGPQVLILAEVPYPPARTVGGGGAQQSRKVYDPEARPPPYGMSEGGVWVKRKYAGETTNLFTAIGCAFFIVPGIYSYLNPVDIRDVYILDGKAYTADGNCIGVAKPAEH